MDIRDFKDREFDPRQLPTNWIVPAVIVLLVLFVGYLVLNSFYKVDANEEAVVLRFGKYYATQQPGLHFCIPLVDRVYLVSLEDRSLRLPYAAGPKRPTGAQVREEETLMLTGDLNAASVEWTMQWKVSDPQEYLFSFHNPNNPEVIDETIEAVIVTAARTVMNQLVGDYSIDEVLITHREEIQEKALQRAQELLDEYECGVLIRGLQVQRITPPERVKPAWDAIEAANQKRDQLESEAYKEREKLLADARASKNQKIESANGYADRRRAEVNGEISALMAKYKAYEQAPDVTRKRLYLEAMQDILSGVETKVIVDSDLRQILPMLQLDQGASQ